MEFTDSVDPPIVYLENLSGGLYLDKPYHVAEHRLAFDHLRAAALSPTDTAELLRARARTAAEPQPRERHHAAFLDATRRGEFDLPR